jgi:steroid 5-alpha reductase family enzyme
MDPWTAKATALVLVLGLMTLVWVASLLKRDASIVDLFWGMGFVVAAWVYALSREEPTPRGDLVLGLASLWGARLSLYILWRNWGGGEDYRYREMREKSPGTFPILQAQAPGTAFPTWLDGTGLVLFAVGFAFEAGGDWQLARFKADPANAGRVMDRGFWRYTRHPNYFGDAVVWWSFFCFALATPRSLWTVYSPIVMTLLLMRVSGVTLLEKKLEKSKPGYRRYAEETNAFFPWLPRRRRGTETAR